MGYRRDQHRLRPRQNRPRGFTIVELLITMALIILLLSILTVAIASVTRTSQSANTRALMNSIKQALASFKADVGYYPPVLDENRDLFTPWGVDANDWYSETALADFLFGYGNEQQDGHGNPGGRPAIGIRHPGPDGVWLATLNGAAGHTGSPSTSGLGVSARQLDSHIALGARFAMQQAVLPVRDGLIGHKDNSQFWEEVLNKLEPVSQAPQIH